MRNLFFVILLVGCGTDPTNTATQQEPTKNGTTVAPVEEQAADPGIGPTNTDPSPTASQMASLTADTIDSVTCDAQNERQLVYVLDQKAFFTCQAGDWVAIDIKGEDGKDGTNGTDNHISSIVTCSPSSLPPTGIKIRYQRIEMSSGDVVATADFYGSSVETFSSTALYSGKQTERLTSEVRIEHDINGSYNGGYVKYVYNSTDNTLTFSIHDVDYVAPLTTSWLVPSTNCAKQVY